MKFFIKSLLLITLVFSLDLVGGSNRFVQEMGYQIDYEKALALAKKENKPIMAVVSTRTCPWCRKMENQTLRDDFINKEIKNYFIPLALDKDNDGYPKKFKSRVVPTIYFISLDSQKAFYTSFGYKTKKEFKTEILKALKAGGTKE